MCFLKAVLSYTLEIPHGDLHLSLDPTRFAPYRDA